MEQEKIDEIQKLAEREFLEKYEWDGFLLFEMERGRLVGSVKLDRVLEGDTWHLEIAPLSISGVFSLDYPQKYRTAKFAKVALEDILKAQIVNRIAREEFNRIDAESGRVASEDQDGAPGTACTGLAFLICAAGLILIVAAIMTVAAL